MRLVRDLATIINKWNYYISKGKNPRFLSCPLNYFLLRLLSKQLSQVLDHRTHWAIFWSLNDLYIRVQAFSRASLSLSLLPLLLFLILLHLYLFMFLSIIQNEKRKKKGSNEVSFLIRISTPSFKLGSELEYQTLKHLGINWNSNFHFVLICCVSFFLCKRIKFHNRI